MERDSRKGVGREGLRGARTPSRRRFGSGSGMIEAIVEEELEATLGAASLAAGRCGAHRLPPWRARTSAHHQSR